MLDQFENLMLLSQDLVVQVVQLELQLLKPLILCFEASDLRSDVIGDWRWSADRRVPAHWKAYLSSQRQ